MSSDRRRAGRDVVLDLPGLGRPCRAPTAEQLRAASGEDGNRLCVLPSMASTRCLIGHTDGLFHGPSGTRGCDSTAGDTVQTIQRVQDAAVAGAAGYVGTKAVERCNTPTYALEAEADRQREEDVRPGPPFRLAAENLAARVVGVELAQDRATKVGMAFHCLAAWSWFPVYLLLRRRLGWGPVASGLGTGASMSLLLGEAISPAIGASAPKDRGPVSTHVRAVAAHLVFCLAVAGVMEVGTGPGRARCPRHLPRPSPHGVLDVRPL